MGRERRGLGEQFVTISDNLGRHTRRHLAYPIVHYFHSASSSTATAVKPGARLAPAFVEPTRRTVKSFLDTLSDSFISPAEAQPPLPDLAVVASAGVPVDADAFEADAYRRRLLRGLVENGGWTWDDVCS